MGLILTLDSLADRYKMLPSQVLDQATTFDLYILDAARSFYNYHEKKANGQVAEDYTQTELEQMVKNARGENE